MSKASVSIRLTQKGRTEPTGKHALELVGVFETASLLQLGDHARFCLVRCRYAVDETLGKLCRIESLEDILLLKILEYNHLRDGIYKNLITDNLESTHHTIQRTLKVTLLRHLVVLA
jgi:hypothetical protein